MRAFAISLLALTALCLLPSGAAAKGLPGERIVEISPEPPPGLAAGRPWDLTVRIRDHRGNLFEGPPPQLSARHLGSGEERDFSAHATRSDGVWRFTAQVPTPGPWRYEVDDGLGLHHAWTAVVAAAPERAETSDDGLPWGWIAGGLASLAVATRLPSPRRWGLSRRRRAR